MLDASREWQGQLENMVQEKFQMHMQNLRIPKKTLNVLEIAERGTSEAGERIIFQCSRPFGKWHGRRHMPTKRRKLHGTMMTTYKETISEHVDACGQSSTAPGQMQLEPGATSHVQQQEVGTAMPRQPHGTTDDELGYL